ncbi:reverse transcriptase domain-containing protein [Tanacetum coccineum]
MLRCVGPLQANYAIREIHMRSCGMHVGPRAVVRKAVRQGYYWPTMHEDAKEEVQKFGLPRIIVTDNAAQLVNDTFKSWYERFEIHQMNTAVARPQANGLVEKANRSLIEASRVEDQGKLGPKWEGPYRVIEAYENGSYKLQTLEDKEVPRTLHAINLRKCCM